MTAVLAIALILLAALLLNSLAAAVMRRFGIAPADESARSQGFGDVVQRFEAWSRARRK